LFVHACCATPLYWIQLCNVAQLIHTLNSYRT
jgi:hypothetical protein